MLAEASDGANRSAGVVGADDLAGGRIGTGRAPPPLPSSRTAAAAAIDNRPAIGLTVVGKAAQQNGPRHSVFMSFG